MRQNIAAFTVRNIGVIPAEIAKQNKAVIRSVSHEELVQVSLETSAVKVNALAFLRSTVVVYQVFLQGWCENTITDYVINGLICHSVAGDVTGFTAFTDEELAALRGCIRAVLQGFLNHGRIKQMIHLEKLSGVLELTARHSFITGLINNVSVKEKIIH